jgi:hypothetical protein
MSSTAVICVSGSRRSPFLIEFGTLSIVELKYDKSSVLALLYVIRLDCLPSREQAQVRIYGGKHTTENWVFEFAATHAHCHIYS